MKFNWKEYRNLDTQWGNYLDGNLALQIVDFQGARIATASVNLDPYGARRPHRGQIWLKGWAENSGLPEVLVEAKIVTPLPELFSTAYVQAQLYQLTPKALEEAREQGAWIDKEAVE